MSQSSLPSPSQAASTAKRSVTGVQSEVTAGDMGETMALRSRIGELESIRGIAALLVVMFHAHLSETHLMARQTRQVQQL
jgi:uncharacterized membrane protein